MDALSRANDNGGKENVSSNCKIHSRPVNPSRTMGSLQHGRNREHVASRLLPRPMDPCGAGFRSARSDRPPSGQDERRSPGFRGALRCLLLSALALPAAGQVNDTAKLLTELIHAAAAYAEYRRAASLMKPSTKDSDLFRALVRQSNVVFPNVPVTTYLFQAGADAAAWRTRNIPVYGIYPYPISAEDSNRMRGNDERVSIESLQQGAGLIYKTLLQVAAK